MENGYIFNKSDYEILELLIGNECFSPFKSLTKQDIIAQSNYSHVKVQQSLKGFILMNLVKEGAKDKNNKTYFCTDIGLKHYKEVFEYTQEQIDQLTESYLKINNENGGEL